MDVKYLKSRCIIMSFVFAISLSGCTGVGKQVIPPDRYGLNESLHLSQNQQLVLNLVRLRYGDAPYFLGVSAVTSSYSLNYGAAGSVDYSKDKTLNGSLSLPIFVTIGKTIARTFTANLSPDVQYTQSPTISYTPLQGEEFTKQLLTPVMLDKFQALGATSWSFEHLFRMVIQSLGPYLNASPRFYAGKPEAPVYKDFLDIARSLQIAYQNNHIKLGVGSVDNIPVLEIRLLKKALNSPENIKLRRYFKVSDVTQPIRLRSASSQVVSPKLKNAFLVETRSILGIMKYLSNGVEVTQSEINRGVVERHWNKDGSFFNFTDITNGLITIKSATKHPLNAFVAVRYRNRFYYIPDSDWQSKQTLMMVTQLFDLLAGNVPNQAPVITIPV